MFWHVLLQLVCVTIRETANNTYSRNADEHTLAFSRCEIMSNVNYRTTNIVRMPLPTLYLESCVLRMMING